jgi:16S rRNA (guanine(966)-N(2))-methyltransferase RsmD
MRVISGIARGIKLKTIPQMTTRPTVDRVKENMFNIIQNNIPGAIVADLFSGSGSLCIESLSRGAKHAYFFDMNKDCISVIKDNLKACGFKEKYDLQNLNHQASIQYLKNNNIKLDIAFLDPPHRSGYGQEAILLIIDSNLLSNDGIIVVEHHPDETYEDEYNNLVKYKYKKYGNTALSFYKMDGE